MFWRKGKKKKKGAPGLPRYRYVAPCLECSLGGRPSSPSLGPVKTFEHWGKKKERKRGPQGVVDWSTARLRTRGTCKNFVRLTYQANIRRGLFAGGHCNKQVRLVIYRRIQPFESLFFFFLGRGGVFFFPLPFPPSPMSAVWE